MVGHRRLQMEQFKLYGELVHAVGRRDRSGRQSGICGGAQRWMLRESVGLWRRHRGLCDRCDQRWRSSTEPVEFRRPELERRRHAECELVRQPSELWIGGWDPCQPDRLSANRTIGCDSARSVSVLIWLWTIEPMWWRFGRPFQISNSNFDSTAPDERDCVTP